MSRSVAVWLLTGGVIGPILFAGGSLVIGWTQPGYDWPSMYVSYLSLGEGGWLEVVTIVVSGLLLAGGALGLRWVMRGGRGSQWAPILIGLAGLGLVVTGILLPDNARGYPPGTPLGPPANPSLIARLHDVAAGFVFIPLIATMLIMARRFAGEPGGGRWAAYTRFSALGTVAFLFASFIQTDVLGVLERIAILLAAGWVAHVMCRFRREAASGPLPRPR